MQCILDKTDEPGIYQCTLCGRRNVKPTHWPPEKVHLQCRSSPVVTPKGGPGTELKKLLKRLGINATSSCGCNDRARAMDVWGADWCEVNIDKIVGWLREAAEQEGLLFVEFAARQLVKLAIRRARRGAVNANP